MFFGKSAGRFQQSTYMIIEGQTATLCIDVVGGSEVVNVGVMTSPVDAERKIMHCSQNT